MKKLLTAMMLLLPLAAMAQHWTAKTNQDYQHETVINVQVNINGQIAGDNDGLELAAFIGEECRADAFAGQNQEPTGEPKGTPVFTLRVSGDGETELTQPITFRAFYNQIEYQFNINTVTFKGDATLYEPSTPLVLNLDAVTDIKLKENIDVNQPTFPYVLDLSPFVELVYGDGEKKNESKILSQITYEWRSPDEMLAFDNANNKVTIQNAGTATATLVVYIGNLEKQEFVSFPVAGPASATFNATIASIPVTGITCDITEPIEFYAFDDFAAYMTEHVTIQPENASDKEYSFVCVEDAEALFRNKFVKGGQFTVNIVPDDKAYQGEPAKVTVKVYVRPTGISTTAENNTINVYFGDNVYTAIKEMQQLTWPEGIVDPGVWGKSEVNYTFDTEGLVDDDGNAIAYGTASVTVVLKDGTYVDPTVGPGPDRYTVTVNITTAVTMNVQATEDLNFFKMEPRTLATVTVNNPKQENFKPTDLAITFSERYPGLPYATCEPKEMSAEGATTTYELVLTPLYVGRCECNVTHLGKSLLPQAVVINISKKDVLSKGWTWLSLITDGGNVSEFLTKDDIVEVRSQDKLTYNDPQYGYFGHLTTLSANEGMYKVMTNKETSVNWGSNAILNSNAQGVPNKVINKGFNWVNYPYEFDVTPDRITEFLGADFTPADGDRIITQGSGFAVYKAETTNWTADETFALKEGKGLMYYSTADDAKTITFNLIPIAKPAEGNVRAESFTMPSLADEILQYDVHAFADNMSMIAEVENLDFPEDYTLGVFVNGKCRGRGRVAVDGKMFVSAVGISGENVTFKLVNNFTGDILPVEGTVSFGMVKGSLQAPVKLNAGDATGINKVGGTQQTNEMYDLSGRRVTGSQRGVIIERMDNGTIRKVVKK